MQVTLAGILMLVRPVQVVKVATYAPGCVGESEVRHPDTATKGLVTNGNNTVSRCDHGQVRAVREGKVTDVRDGVRNAYASQAALGFKAVVPN
jgi:hypothetical protein